MSIDFWLGVGTGVVLSSIVFFLFLVRALCYALKVHGSSALEQQQQEHAEKLLRIIAVAQEQGQGATDAGIQEVVGPLPAGLRY